MEETAKSQYQMAWHIYAGEPSPNTFHSGYPTEPSAIARTHQLNKEAEKLGIEARYEAMAKPFGIE